MGGLGVIELELAIAITIIPELLRTTANGGWDFRR